LEVEEVEETCLVGMVLLLQVAEKVHHLQAAVRLEALVEALLEALVEAEYLPRIRLNRELLRKNNSKDLVAMTDLTLDTRHLLGS
jgi:hypothetical protein